MNWTPNREILDKVLYLSENKQFKELGDLMRPLPEDTVEEVAEKIYAYAEYFNGEVFEYKPAQFHYQRMYDKARIIKGERLWTLIEGMKELGKTTLELILSCYEKTYGTSEMTRYIHYENENVTEFINAHFNHFMRDDIRRVYGDLILRKSESKDKKRYTQKVLEFSNGEVIVGQTSLQVGTGKVAYITLPDGKQKALRVKRQIVDDPLNVIRAKSAVENAKGRDILEDTIRGCDQAETEIIIITNPNEQFDFIDEYKRDKRFNVRRIFLFKGDEERAEDLTWKGKYLMTDEQVKRFKEKYPDRKPKVSVESLKRSPDYKKAYLGHLIDKKDLVYSFGEDYREPGKVERMGETGGIVKKYKKYNPSYEHFISTDSGAGEGGDNTALLVARVRKDNNGKEWKETCATFRSNQINTKSFAKHILIPLLEEYENSIYIGENDGAEGKVLIELVLDEIPIRRVYREKIQEDVVAGTRPKKYGYIPSSSRNEEGKTLLRNAVNDWKLFCKDLIEEADRYTWLVHQTNSRAGGGIGHFDLLRALMISNYAMDHREKSVGKVLLENL